VAFVEHPVHVKEFNLEFCGSMSFLPRDAMRISTILHLLAL